MGKGSSPASAAVVTAVDLAHAVRGFDVDPAAEETVSRSRLFGADGVEYRYRPVDDEAPRMTCRSMVLSWRW